MASIYGYPSLQGRSPRADDLATTESTLSRPRVPFLASGDRVRWVLRTTTRSARLGSNPDFAVCAHTGGVALRGFHRAGHPVPMRDWLRGVGRTAASRLGCFRECLLDRGTPAEPNVRLSPIRLPDYLAIVRRGRRVAPRSRNPRWLTYQLWVW